MARRTPSPSTALRGAQAGRAARTVVDEHDALSVAGALAVNVHAAREEGGAHA